MRRIAPSADAVDNHPIENALFPGRGSSLASQRCVTCESLTMTRGNRRSDTLPSLYGLNCVSQDTIHRINA
jgi:hypothetical protein